MSNILITVGFLLNLFCFFPYLKDVLKKKTEPHIYTWFIWSVSQGIGFYATYKSGASFASFIILSSFLCVFIIFLLSFRYGSINVTSFDKKCLLFTFATIFAYLFFKDPLYSILLAVTTDVLAYFPTLRKVYEEPYTETISFYYISVFAQSLGVFSLSEWTLRNSFFAFAMIFINTLTTIVIVYARKFK